MAKGYQGRQFETIDIGGGAIFVAGRKKIAWKSRFTEKNARLEMNTWEIQTDTGPTATSRG
jgi:hypothetical protein